MSVSLTKHKTYVDGLELESWDDTIHRMLPHIRNLELESIEMLKMHRLNQDRKIISTNSTGKDSMVVTHLAEKADLDFETYFNVTTLDVAESNKMAKQNGFKHIFPDPKYNGFYNYIQRYNGGRTNDSK